MRVVKHGVATVAGVILSAAALTPLTSSQAQTGSTISAPTTVPVFEPDGRLAFPDDYRVWVYLSSGLDMSYNPAMKPAHSTFDNVFVNPPAYREFMRSGMWPDGTMLAMEVRGASGTGSINRAGHFQTPAMLGLEVHVKDATRFVGGWGFFAFDGRQPATILPPTAECYACHEHHGAVQTTFVQFYPTLLDVAKAKGTFTDGREVGAGRR